LCFEQTLNWLFSYLLKAISILDNNEANKHDASNRGYNLYEIKHYIIICKGKILIIKLILAFFSGEEIKESRECSQLIFLRTKKEVEKYLLVGKCSSSSSSK
jgi:uncharacterized protein Smg (DUF494 family)